MRYNRPFNATNFTHPTMRAKIDAAMREAVERSLSGAREFGVQYGQSYITNNRGEVILSVRHYRGECQAIQFYAPGSVNVTADVLKAIRS